MLPTRRLGIFASLATLLAVLAGYAPSLRPALFAADAVVIAGVVVDVLFALGRRVEVDRRVAAIFSVGRPNVVTLRLRNRGRRTLRGWAADDPLESCSSIGTPCPFVVAPHGTVTLKYEIQPSRRGPRTLGAVTVRYASPLGLVWSQERTPLPANVDVYPDVHAARSLELLRRQGRQDARVGSLRVRGGDTEFERLRPYQRGDEVRHIDWRASARRDELVVRQFQAESNQNVVFALDVGRGMRGETGGLTAVDHAINAVLLTADVALRGGDKAGLMVFDEAPRRFLPPTGGRQGGRKLTRAVYALEAGLGATDYRAATAFLAAQVRARSLFVVFTNLLDPRSSRDLAASLRGLLPRHLPLCVLLRDTDVEALADAPVRGAEDLYVRAAAAESLAWRDGLIRGLTSAGVLVLDASPEALTPELVKSYLSVKARRLL
ncbi:MAG TPA: DUF58 domain-containing protein [Polyangiaceae bacterium]|nr:DUF58 domain-containing protein [Polyangiaceae bacterium]